MTWYMSVPEDTIGLFLYYKRQKEQPPEEIKVKVPLLYSIGLYIPITGHQEFMGIIALLLICKTSLCVVLCV